MFYLMNRIKENQRKAAEKKEAVISAQNIKNQQNQQNKRKSKEWKNG